MIGLVLKLESFRFRDAKATKSVLFHPRLLLNFRVFATSETLIISWVQYFKQDFCSILAFLFSANVMFPQYPCRHVNTALEV